MKNAIDKYNVIWNTPSEDSSGSMPLRNGDIGLNVWVEEDGDLLFYIGKTDTWDENCRLLKLSRIRVKLEPNPFKKGMPYEQTLSLVHGEILISAGIEGQNVSMRIWVDANHPVAHIEVNSEHDINCEVGLEVWRTEERPMVLEDKREGRTTGGSDGSHSEQGLIMAGLNPMITADVVLPQAGERTGSIVWYHRNETSIWYGELSHQGMENFAQQAKDPLLHRTFGGKIWGENFINCDDKAIKSENPCKDMNISVCLLTAQVSNVDDWLKELETTVDKIKGLPIEEARQAHLKWWKAFWNRSWVRVSGGDNKETDALTMAWHLHRFTVACTARGNFPVKFNGSIFNVDGYHAVSNAFCYQGYDADFRAWGGCFWFQNQRQIYWPMLSAGDFDCMLPFFKMYLDALPFAKALTSTWFKHEGAFFPECMYFWGSYNRTDYGMKPACEREDMAQTDSGYVKRYWQGGLELACMMLEYYMHTQDSHFLQEILLPIVAEVITFYHVHYPRDSKGKIHFEPAQALETLWDVTNLVPEIAGLHRLLKGLLALPEGLIPQSMTKVCKIIFDELPPLPVKLKDGKLYLDACEENRSGANNIENIAMYAVFPYRMFGIGKPELDMIRNTYDMRAFTDFYYCWSNDNVFAAYLGLVEEAKKSLAKRYTLHGGYRFPTFYVDGDWVPDHDNGGVAQQTLQAMLMQTDGNEILLFPTWPKEWDVEFKLNAPLNTVIEGKLKSGEIEFLKVFPEERLKDIVVLNYK